MFTKKDRTEKVKLPHRIGCDNSLTLKKWHLALRASMPDEES